MAHIRRGLGLWPCQKDVDAGRLATRVLGALERVSAWYVRGLQLIAPNPNPHKQPHSRQRCTSGTAQRILRQSDCKFLGPGNPPGTVNTGVTASSQSQRCRTRELRESNSKFGGRSPYRSTVNTGITASGSGLEVAHKREDKH